MGNKTILEFFQKAEKDPELRAKVQSLTVQDAKQAFADLARIAQAAGYNVSADAVEVGLREYMPGELGDDQLEQVAGGFQEVNKIPAFPYDTPAFGKSVFGNIYQKLGKTDLR